MCHDFRLVPRGEDTQTDTDQRPPDDIRVNGPSWKSDLQPQSSSLAMLACNAAAVLADI